MILRILEVELRGPCHLELSFNDGLRAIVDVEPLLNGPVFEPLREPSYFAQVVLDPVCGTVVWPNGADFAPESLHALIGVGLSTPNQALQPTGAAIPASQGSKSLEAAPAAEL